MSVDKQCTECGEIKPLSGFRNRTISPDGLDYRCRVCRNASGKAWRKANPKRTAAYSKAWGERNGAQLSALKKAYKNQNPIKVSAHKSVANAVKVGKLTRLPCEVCGTDENIQAHHCDYSKRFEVLWLCQKHHKAWHQEHGAGLNGEQI